MAFVNAEPSDGSPGRACAGAMKLSSLRSSVARDYSGVGCVREAMDSVML
jgi:hypothetical protein